MKTKKTKAELLQEQTERNKRRLEKKEAGYFVIWYRKSRKYVKGLIKKASREGRTHLRLDNDALYHLVNWDIYHSVGADKVMTKIAEDLTADGFGVVHVPYNGAWCSGRMDIDWGNKEEEE